MTETVELPPAFLDEVKAMTPKRQSPRSEAESPIKHIGSLFHALSNKDKIRRDVDGPQFLKELKNDTPKKNMISPHGKKNSPKKSRSPIKSRSPKKNHILDRQ